MAVFRSAVKSLVPDPIARLARRALLWERRASFRPYVITKTVGGESFPFRIGDETGELWYREPRAWTSPELPFIRDRMLSTSDLVFDVGAHHGLWAVLMARHCRHVLAIEPNPHNVAILKENIKLNALANVAIRQAAAGEALGSIALFADSGQGGVAREAGSAALKVELLTLDQLAREYGFPQMLKIDVEGSEAFTLKGASQILERRPKIAIEVHVEWVGRYGSSVSEVIRLLHLEFYRVWVLPHKSRLEPWNGQEFNYAPSKFTLFLLPR